MNTYNIYDEPSRGEGGGTLSRDDLYKNDEAGVLRT